jgi:hypothetical protein
VSIEQFVRKGTRRSHLSPTWRLATSALMATAVTMGALGAWPTSASAAPPSPPSNPAPATPTPNPHALEHGLGLKLETPEKLRNHPFHTPRKAETVGGTAPTGTLGTCPDNLALRGSLVARVGSGPVQLVGSGPTSLTGTGTLQLAYNDVIWDFANNSGGFQVTVVLQ